LPQELADLTIQFYRRNYIEGLFLSAAVEISPDYTMKKFIQVWTLQRSLCISIQLVAFLLSLGAISLIFLKGTIYLQIYIIVIFRRILGFRN
jgi:hypothetical protein